MFREKKVYHKRKFLNPSKDSNANINADIIFEPNKYNKQGKYIRGQLSGTVKISDCDRTVRLEMYGWNKKEREQNYKKLENLIEILEEYRDVYAAYMEEL